jgi:hypothetical protein
VDSPIYLTTKRAYVCNFRDFVVLPMAVLRHMSSFASSMPFLASPMNSQMSPTRQTWASNLDC